LADEIHFGMKTQLEYIMELYANVGIFKIQIPNGFKTFSLKVYFLAFEKDSSVQVQSTLVFPSHISRTSSIFSKEICIS